MFGRWSEGWRGGVLNGVVASETSLIPLGQASGGKLAEYRFELRRGDRAIPVRVVRRRRKTLALHIEKDREAELRVPVNGAWSDIERFLCSRFDWIVAAQSELAARPTIPRNAYTEGGLVRYLGVRHQLELVRSRYNLVNQDGDKILVACRTPENPKSVEKQVLSWYRRQAETLLPTRLDLINQRFLDRISPGTTTVRKMKARWGSCASNGDICFNLYLIQEQLSQIDFVVAHELCHLRHFAHNEAFYRLLDEVMPDWRSREASLGQSA